MNHVHSKRNADAHTSSINQTQLHTIETSLMSENPRRTLIFCELNCTGRIDGRDFVRSRSYNSN